ncbi:Gfo/Idh/MocA family oxidoreductase [Aeoliella sp. ICT_H6.2]|uniref:Gfo/Idh/MocA family oxidoreductase n=1 Tax=Aeoliella straminimaris TaxID=2954799 RepID=A0A9X2JIJ9_9BACT|nr:Gfo/Idh/MocA family oxidoreductase [Aeoliella straminimaris]MCO6044009.1 Gfo/Idh/MocA family oxidoreductase [Aeoliella straminimaris]
MRSKQNRRDFLRTSAAAGAGYWALGGIATAQSKSPNEQLQVAGVGVGGKGDGDVKNASRSGKLVALCDTDSRVLEGMESVMKTGNTFADFREMLDSMGDQIDVVTVSTPDHMHAPIAAAAMKAGKHVYCQKPLTRTIWEARRLQEIAKEMDVVTQMGNQYTCFNPMRKAAYQIKAGNLGNVKEVHVWTNRPVWPQGGPRPEPAEVPENLSWDLWLGVAPKRPYAPDAYHDFKWRGWWDFGTGALGDMACHTCNLPYMGLTMRDPVSVEATTSGHNGDSYPEWSTIKFEFPELNGRAPFTLYWYDGGKKPDNALFTDFKMKNDDGTPAPSSTGALIVGDKAKMYAAGDYAEKGIEIFGADEMDVDYPRARGGGDLAHNREFFAGIRDRSKKPMSNIVDYSGPLTETILLGNLSVWKGGEKVLWDAKTMTPLNDESLMKIVKPDYQNGYELI